MTTDRCPWCDAIVQCERMLGRGYIPMWDPPRIQWTCGSGRMSDDAEPVQSPKCIALIFREVEELRGEAQNVKRQRDDLLLLLDTTFKERHPVVIKPEWLTVAASLREAAEARGK